MAAHNVKRVAKKYFTPIYMLVVLLFLCWFFYKSRTSLLTYLQNFNAAFLCAAFILQAGFCFFQALAFIQIQSHNSRIAPKSIIFTNWFYAYIYGLMGHYIPGKISVVLGRIMALSPFGITREAAILCIFYETLITVAISFAVGLPLILIADIIGLGQHYLRIALAILIFATLTVFIFTPLFKKSVFMILRRFKIPLPGYGIFLNRQAMCRAVIRYGISFLCLMLAFYCFCRSIADLSCDFRTFYIVGASLVFSGAVGLIALFAPSGLGVREAGIVYFTAVATSLIPLEIALLIAVCYRLLTAIVETALFLIMAGLYKRTLKKHYM